jgi:hypothetical protein
LPRSCPAVGGRPSPLCRSSDEPTVLTVAPPWTNRAKRTFRRGRSTPPRGPPPAGIGRSSSASDATGSLPRSSTKRIVPSFVTRAQEGARIATRQTACLADLSPQPPRPGRWVTCDLPERPGTTTHAGCMPWRQGSWARPSNRPQATLGCDPSESAPRPSRRSVDRSRRAWWRASAAGYSQRPQWAAATCHGPPGWVLNRFTGEAMARRWGWWSWRSQTPAPPVAAAAAPGRPPQRRRCRNG